MVDRVRVRRALAALSPGDQEVLRLTAWEGLDAADAAVVLGCSRTAYKVRLFRARRRLAAALDPPPTLKPAYDLAPEGGSR